MMHKLTYGRKLEDFEVGATYPHPWEVTVTSGMAAIFQASFMDATRTYASKHFAQQLGFTNLPVPPLLLMNLGLSFSVHDVSEQAIAHLAYINVRFPNPAYLGDTLFASSKVLGVKATSSGDKGVVHVETLVENQDGTVVCAFERKALIRAGKVSGRPPSDAQYTAPTTNGLGDRPEALQKLSAPPAIRGASGIAPASLKPGDIFCHQVGKTIGDSEHMQLTVLMRNSHPLHFDEHYCKDGNSFKGTRVVYGGLVLSWVATLASRDLGGHSLWDLQLDAGAHPNGVVAGDTLYAASRIESIQPLGNGTREVTLRLVGTKNCRPESILEQGKDLFSPELKKDKTDRIPEKVVEITRKVLIASP